MNSITNILIFVLLDNQLEIIGIRKMSNLTTLFAYGNHDLTEMDDKQLLLC